MIIYGFLFLLLRTRDVCSTRSQRLLAIGTLVFISVALSTNSLDGVLVLLLGFSEILYTVRPILLFKTCTASHLTLLHAETPGVILASHYRSTHGHGLKLGADNLIHHRRQKHLTDGQLCLGMRRSHCYVDNLIEALLGDSNVRGLRSSHSRFVHKLGPTTVLQLMYAFVVRILRKKNAISHSNGSVVVTELSTTASAASYESEVDQMHVLSNGYQLENHHSHFSSFLERIRLIHEARQARRLNGFLRRRGRPVDKRKTQIPFTSDWMTGEDNGLEALPPS